MIDPATIAMLAQVAMGAMKGQSAPPAPDLPGGANVSMDPRFDTVAASPSANKSAHGRTLEEVNTGKKGGVTHQGGDMAMPIGSPVAPGSFDLGLAAGMDPNSTPEGGFSLGLADEMPTEMGLGLTPGSGGGESLYQQISLNDNLYGKDSPLKGMFGDMSPMELSMLGLAFGSQLFGGSGQESGPRAPGLPGGGGVSMRPVFRG